MGKIQSTRKLLLRRVAVATGAGLLAVVAGLGMAPAGAADGAEVGVEAEGDGVERFNPDLGSELYNTNGDTLDASLGSGIDVKGDEGSVKTQSKGYLYGDLTVHEVMGSDTSSGFEGELGLVIQQDHGFGRSP